jgi:tetratricopeptide (TPR) repeat protein
LGVLYLNAERLEEAAESLREAIEIRRRLADRHPHVPAYEGRLTKTYFTLARVHAQRGKWKAVLEDCTAAVQLNPNYWQAWYQRGIAHAELGQLGNASADFSEAVESGAQWPDVWRVLAIVQLALDDIEGYRRTCQGMLDRFGGSDSVEVGHCVAWTCSLGPAAVADFERVIDLAKRGVAADEKKQGPCLRTLGAVLCRARELDQAIRRLNESIEAGGDDGAPYEWLCLALTHHQLGHSDDAREWFAKAVKWLNGDPVEAGNRVLQPRELMWYERLELQLLREEAESLILAERE